MEKRSSWTDREAHTLSTSIRAILHQRGMRDITSGASQMIVPREWVEENGYKNLEKELRPYHDNPPSESEHLKNAPYSLLLCNRSSLNEKRTAYSKDSEQANILAIADPFSFSINDQRHLYWVVSKHSSHHRVHHTTTPSQLPLRKTSPSQESS